MSMNAVGTERRNQLSQLLIVLSVCGAMIVAGVWGVIASYYAGYSQWIYFQTKFAPEHQKASIDEVLLACEYAQQLYPHNYYFSMYAASRALDAAFDLTDEQEDLVSDDSIQTNAVSEVSYRISDAQSILESVYEKGGENRQERLMSAADHWSKLAVSHNSYLDSVAFIRARVLEKSGRISDAVALWQRVVEDEFWNPEHHAYMARLMLIAGMLDEAEDELLWTRSLASGRAVKSDIDKARKRRELLGIP